MHDVQQWRMRRLAHKWPAAASSATTNGSAPCRSTAVSQLAPVRMLQRQCTRQQAATRTLSPMSISRTTALASPLHSLPPLSHRRPWCSRRRHTLAAPTAALIQLAWPTARCSGMSPCMVRVRCFSFTSPSDRNHFAADGMRAATAWTITNPQVSAARDRSRARQLRDLYNRPDYRIAVCAPGQSNASGVARYGTASGYAKSELRVPCEGGGRGRG